MTSNEKPAFEGWAVLELMGHRKLGGLLSEAVVGGAAFIRIDVPTECEGGPSASWCPEHGTCVCPADAKTQPECPLHSAKSRHGEEGCEIAATQFYSPAAVYCITPCTEETARALARGQRPAPVQRYELLPEKTATRVCDHGVALNARCNACVSDASDPDPEADDEPRCEHGVAESDVCDICDVDPPGAATDSLRDDR